MNDEYYYLIFRVYSKKERPDPRDRVVFYGWTRHKSVRNAFLEQRSPDKYQSGKYTLGEIEEMYNDDNLERDTMIDFINLKSAATGEEVPFFSTQAEFHQIEIDIQEMFRNACKLSVLKGDLMTYVQIICHLDPYFADALDDIGFRPPELESLFPSADDDYYDGLTPVEAQLEMAYNGSLTYPVEEDSRRLSIAGRDALLDPIRKALYSLESVVIVAKDNL